MLNFDAPADAATAAEARGIPILVELEFSTGTQRFTLWSDDITTTTGFLFRGIGSLCQVRGLSESEDRSAKVVTFAFTIVDKAMLAACIGPASVYRRRRARVLIQMMDSNFQRVGAPVERWNGYMDQVSVEREDAKKRDDTKSSGKILLKCSRAGMPASRRMEGLRSTHNQQIARFPGDMGLEYQQTLIEQPSVWLSKRFQEQ